jgi:hypothetical protein
VQVSSDHQTLEFKKGKLSVVAEKIDLCELEISFERIEGFPKDADPAHVSSVAVPQHPRCASAAVLHISWFEGSVAP